MNEMELLGCRWKKGGAGKELNDNLRSWSQFIIRHIIFIGIFNSIIGNKWIALLHPRVELANLPPPPLYPPILLINTPFYSNN